MLVLTRKNNEAIQVGDDIKIVILGIENDRVKIGIEAPQETKIMRAELIREIRQINQEATQADPCRLTLAISQKKSTKDKK